MKSSELIYIVKIWLTSACVGTIFFIIATMLMQSHTAIYNVGEIVPFYFIATFIAALAAIPAAVLLFLCLQLFMQVLVNKLLIQILLAIIAFILGLFTFSFVGIGFSAKESMILSCYCLPLVGSIFFYKMEA